jgi:pSer/pThr/pTyr-binding forkhead associated (FHA) protein
MPTIVMRRGPEPGRVFHLEGETVQIGRGRKNEIVIHDNEVSREHCVLNRAGDNYELRDLGSSNGTFLNGQRVTGDGWLLKSDCLIEIGDSITLEYLAGQVHFDEATSRLVRPYVVVLVDSSTSGPEVYPLEGELIRLAAT